MNAYWTTNAQVQGEKTPERNAEIERLIVSILEPLANLGVVKVDMELHDISETVDELEQALLGDEIPPGHEYIDEEQQ